MQTVSRIHLKPDAAIRNELIDLCLTKDRDKQYVAIGWSYVYKTVGRQDTYQDYYDIVLHAEHEAGHNLPHCLNVFRDTKENDLFWTRDMSGAYWLCRAKTHAMSAYEAGFDESTLLHLDIGAVVPVEAFRYGTEVPGRIKASFNRPRGGTSEIFKDELTQLYSMWLFNFLSGRSEYNLDTDDQLRAWSKRNLLQNLPEFELEELVMSYIQVKHDYYLLSNSIANKSTTVKIEGEFLSRDPTRCHKAVVQVKGPGYTDTLSGASFTDYLDDGYEVFLYAPRCSTGGRQGVTIISPDELKQFYEQYKAVLPRSITQWENIFAIPQSE